MQRHRQKTKKSHKIEIKRMNKKRDKDKHDLEWNQLVQYK